MGHIVLKKYIELGCCLVQIAHIPYYSGRFRSGHLARSSPMLATGSVTADPEMIEIVTRPCGQNANRNEPISAISQAQRYDI